MKKNLENKEVKPKVEIKEKAFTPKVEVSKDTRLVSKPLNKKELIAEVIKDFKTKYGMEPSPQQIIRLLKIKEADLNEKGR